MATYFTQGVVLRHATYREADRLLIVYTVEQGKLELVARGARKITSKLAGSLEPCTEVRLMVARGKSYGTVAAADVVRIFPRLKRRWQTVSVATYVAAVLDAVTPLNQHDARVYQLVISTLVALDRPRLSAHQLRVIVWFFTWRLLGYLGYAPELYQCLQCQRRLTLEGNHLDFKRGGVLCSRCPADPETSRSVSSAVIKLLRLILRQQRVAVERVSVQKALVADLTQLTEAYLAYTQECSLSLKTFLLSR